MKRVQKKHNKSLKFRVFKHLVPLLKGGTRAIEKTIKQTDSWCLFFIFKRCLKKWKVWNEGGKKKEPNRLGKGGKQKSTNHLKNRTNCGKQPKNGLRYTVDGKKNSFLARIAK